MTDWLFDTIIVTTLILGAVLVLRKPVANFFGPNVAYFLWLLPAARLVMPSLAVEQTAAAQNPTPLVGDNMIEAAASVQYADLTQTLIPPSSLDFGMMMVSIWLGGAALLFVIQMARYVAMRDELLSDATYFGTTEGIKLIQSDRVSGPLAFGLFARYIAVPDNFTALYSAQERDLAVQHEIAHHKSGDLFANLVAFIILCLMWFNPLAWMSWRAFRFDQEAACDARVLAGKAPEMRQVYGQALVRCAQESLPTFATALNSPKTIIARLRQLTMDDISKRRRLLGKIGVFAAIGIILPLTATTVSVAADNGVMTVITDDVKPGDKPSDTVKIIRMTRIKNVGPDGSRDIKTPFVHTITRGGRTIVLQTNYALSETELDKMANEAEASRVEADDAIDNAQDERADAEEARRDAEQARAEAAQDRTQAQAEREDARAIAVANIPEIRFSHTHKNCKGDGVVTSNVTGAHGQNKARVEIVMCGKAQARFARAEAVKGLQDALNEIENEKDMPGSIRKQVMNSLRGQIRRMQRED